MTYTLDSDYFRPYHLIEPINSSQIYKDSDIWTQEKVDLRILQKMSIFR